MPILTLIGIIFGLIKLILQVIEFLKEHPDVPGEAQRALSKLQVTMENAQVDLRLEANRTDIQAP